jgi:hypothetical protein
VYDEDMLTAPAPVKLEREVGLGTLGLPGVAAKGVHLVLLSTKNTQEYFLGHMRLNIIWLLRARMHDVAKHDIHKLEVPEHMVHIMAPATKQLKFAVYEWPALNVASLIEKQYAELMQDQHPVNEWNMILLASWAGRFDNALECK